MTRKRICIYNYIYEKNRAVFEWDEAKRRLNIESHGIDFIDAKEIWLGAVLEMTSPQKHHGEDRIVAIGFRRFLSARK